MKYLLMMALASICFVSSAFGEVDMKQPVYKILTAQEWQQFQSQGQFQGSPVDQKDGFIHLSPGNQVERIITKYYAGIRPVYVVKFVNADFLKQLTWEAASDGELYPHLYNAPLVIGDVEGFEVIK